ncbi:MAG: hypothetical protein GXX96_05720 [Planctomycetaceae bacterium]|nr:hypothetical protein [Planctomycetaceae bacterium]
MPKTTNEILAAELQKLATKTSGEETGASVVGWVAKKLPDDAFQTTFQTQADPETVLRAALAAIQEKGQVRDGVEAPVDIASVSGVIGSGFLGLNPAVVTVQVNSRDGNVTDVVVTGVAKEGLIKQHAGEKAAKAIARQLMDLNRPQR